MQVCLDWKPCEVINKMRHFYKKHVCNKLTNITFFKEKEGWSRLSCSDNHPWTHIRNMWRIAHCTAMLASRNKPQQKINLLLSNMVQRHQELNARAPTEILERRPVGRAHLTATGLTIVTTTKAAFTRAILRVGGRLHLTADTQKAVGWRVSWIGTWSTSTS